MSPKKFVSIFFTGCKGLHRETIFAESKVSFLKVGRINISL